MFIIKWSSGDQPNDQKKGHHPIITYSRRQSSRTVLVWRHSLRSSAGLAAAAALIASRAVIKKSIPDDFFYWLRKRGRGLYWLMLEIWWGCIWFFFIYVYLCSWREVFVFSPGFVCFLIQRSAKAGGWVKWASGLTRQQWDSRAERPTNPTSLSRDLKCWN